MKLNKQIDFTINNKFDKIQKLLHWSMAFLILLMLFALIGFANEMTTEEHKEMLVGHSSIGSIISILLLFRIIKRFTKNPKTAQTKQPKWQVITAKAVHFGLYLSMILVPVTGYFTARLHELPVMVFGSFKINASAHVYSESNFEFMRNSHEFSIILLISLITIHISAAICHKVILKDDVLKAMLPEFKK
ncbi:cytochrome b/b6 domain-containing protein [Pseudoalteromonas sp. C2R02]|uniref:cytochrome b n=1 Tax=Pseudoalteromonas sp. C2R02 TaxID=2841565 RepID=UPI001C08E826|nr:cytochrome b/b6 domain-containing protein [Pseudoalteromonas sp. C2R02]MBU2968205.1 cytochrome b/b6 domain-containing protein [Pseudoalteromonas sp. C2R02]